MLTVLLLIVAAWVLFSVVAAVATVGKPRKPLTGGGAGAAVVIWGAIIAVLICAAIEVS